tara:strand:- start:780 stop:926 length:147 start_codon:yes stop_codon:yes gene_type:complete
MGYMDWWADRDAFSGGVEVYSPAHKFLPKKGKADLLISLKVKRRHISQ